MINFWAGLDFQEVDCKVPSQICKVEAATNTDRLSKLEDEMPTPQAWWQPDDGTNQCHNLVVLVKHRNACCNGVAIHAFLWSKARASICVWKVWRSEGRRHSVCIRRKLGLAETPIAATKDCCIVCRWWHFVFCSGVSAQATIEQLKKELEAVFDSQALLRYCEQWPGWRMMNKNANCCLPGIWRVCFCCTCTGQRKCQQFAGDGGMKFQVISDLPIVCHMTQLTQVIHKWLSDTQVIHEGFDMLCTSPLRCSFHVFPRSWKRADRRRV